MIPIPSGARVWLVTGHTDMRKGFDGLALIVQETLRRDAHSGHLFVFRGRRGSLIKCLWSDGQVPVATCVGIGWRVFGRHEAIRSCGQVNDLIVWFLGEGLPSVDLAHGDLS